ncbi:MAG: ABC transporter substrate binding protein [Enterocloster sp.]
MILDKALQEKHPGIRQRDVSRSRSAAWLPWVSTTSDLGNQTGKMAARVLKGEKKASEMNFETIEEAAFYGNSKVAGNLGITLPRGIG